MLALMTYCFCFFQTLLDGNNVLAYLDPAGLISLRLSNPRHSHNFDRTMRKSYDKQGTQGISSQSSATKFISLDFRKLGKILRGDLVALGEPGNLRVQGFANRQPCRYFFHVNKFHKKDDEYFATGSIWVHSSFVGLQPFVAQLESHDCYVSVAEMSSVEKSFSLLDYESSCRALQIDPIYSSVIYSDNNPGTLGLLTPAQRNSLARRLEDSLEDSAVKVPINIHCDDASMVTSKMWRSASVIGCQIAGATAGVKGSEHNNFIVALTPTVKISLKRVFDEVIQKLVFLEDGFDTFDCFSGQVEKVKIPVTIVMSDLAAKAEVTPLKGYRADVFCSRDMLNSRTGVGFEQKRDLNLLRDQIQEIRDTRLAVDRHSLGVSYGIDEKHLDTPLDDLYLFDLTRDLPADILHHLTLGWAKKAVEALKDDILSAAGLNEVCAIFDGCVIWKEYKVRTTSSALRSIGSQIGRNIKSMLQVLWYALYLHIMEDPASRNNLFSTLRTIYYLSKTAYFVYNENEVVWTERVMVAFYTLIRTVAAYFNREMPDIMRGAKSHDLIHHLLEDVARHGSPAGFDCSPSESKMRVQKLKNFYSNKSAPSVDVALKIMTTEITRHIFDGGVLNLNGTDVASENVLNEGRSCQSFRQLLGQEEISPPLGSVSLNDYEKVNGRRRFKKTLPPAAHTAIGVPNRAMKTCRKIKTGVGNLFRDGGFYIEGSNSEINLFLLAQIYKEESGHCYAVAEILIRDEAKEDIFLSEVGIKVFKRTNKYQLCEDLYTFHAVPLFHACMAENPVVCCIRNSVHQVREERQIVDQTGIHYKCLSRKGTYFLVNPLAYSGIVLIKIFPLITFSHFSDIGMSI